MAYTFCPIIAMNEPVTADASIRLLKTSFMALAIPINIDKKGRKHLIKKILSSDDPCKVLVVTLTNEVKTIETC